MGSCIPNLRRARFRARRRDQCTRCTIVAGDKPREETMATLDLRSMVRAMYDSWNTKDLERVESYAQPDCRVTNVAFGRSLAFKDYERNWATAFPDGAVELT